MGVYTRTKKQICSIAGHKLSAGHNKKTRSTGGRKLASKKCK